jgi:hypothetical protein
MDVDRRSVVKGIAVGGALLACGAPRWALAGASGPDGRPCALLLGHADASPAFARGARAVLERAGCPELALGTSPGAPLGAAGALSERMARSRATRWIAVLDDAGAAIFQELVRSAEGRLLARGHHGLGSDGVLRAAWVAASPDWCTAALLASCLRKPPANVSITESFLAAAVPAEPSADPRGLLHPGSDWIECVGQAVAASALGLGARHRLPADSAQRAGARGAGAPPAARFVSFVVDL